MATSSLLFCCWSCLVHGRHLTAPLFPSSKYRLCSSGTLLARVPKLRSSRLHLPPLLFLVLPLVLHVLLLQLLLKVLQHVPVGQEEVLAPGVQLKVLQQVLLLVLSD